MLMTDWIVLIIIDFSFTCCNATWLDDRVECHKASIGQVIKAPLFHRDKYKLLREKTVDEEGCLCHPFLCQPVRQSIRWSVALSFCSLYTQRQ